MTKKCVILVGVPGSGKSTWINNTESKRLAENNESARAISTDRIIESIAHSWGFSYDQAFSDLIKFAEKVMWKDLTAHAELGSTLYIDRTNLSVKSRKKFIDFLEPYGYEFEAVVFETPDDEEWQRRLDRPGKTIPVHVLESMADNIEIPTMSEGFAKITYID